MQVQKKLPLNGAEKLIEYYTMGSDNVAFRLTENSEKMINAARNCKNADIVYPGFTNAKPA